MLDLANSGMVFLAACMAWADVRALAKDKSLRGVQMGTVALLTAWPVWDLTYYSGLGQTSSMVACCVLVCARSCWAYLAWCYRGR